MCLRVNSLSITRRSLPSSLGIDSNTSPARRIRSCTLVHHKIRTKRKRNKRKKILGFLYPLRISRSRVGRRVVGCQSSPPPPFSFCNSLFVSSSRLCVTPEVIDITFEYLRPLMLKLISPSDHGVQPGYLSGHKLLWFRGFCP